MTASIAVRCTVSRGHVAAVALQPRRPLPVERLAVGRTPAEAIRLFSSLFSLCPEAHCLAAGRALADAQGQAVPADLQNLQEARRELEIVKEHALDLLLRQPLADPTPARDILDAYATLRAALGGTAIYRPLETPLDVDTTALQAGLDEWDRILQASCGDFWHLAEPDLAAVRRWQERQDPPPPASYAATPNRAGPTSAAAMPPCCHLCRPNGWSRG